MASHPRSHAATAPAGHPPEKAPHADVHEGSRRRAWTLLGLCLACTLYLVPVFPHYPSANEISRWVLVAGLWERGEAEVSWAVPLIGPLVDASRVGGSIYPNKAPGLALIAAPGYLLARLFLGPPSHRNARWSLYAMRVFGATIPLALLGLLMMRRTNGDPLALGSLLLATPVFAYGTLLFSHVSATACLYAAYLLLFGERREPQELGRCLAAGALCGLATTTEYTVAVGTAILAFGILASPQRWPRLTAFVIGGAPFAALLAFYNYALFGSPFSLSSAHEASAVTAALASEGVFGISWPTFDSTWRILFSPSRGLMFFSPILAIALWAVVPRRGDNVASWMRLALAVAPLLLAMGYGGNHGGWSVGARYALLAVPFLIEAVWVRKPRAGGAIATLFVISMVLCVAPLFTFPFPPPQFPWVHAHFVRPLLAEGFLTPTLGNWVVSGWWALTPVLAALAAAVPLTLGWSRRVAVGTLSGVLVATAVFFVPVPDNPAQTMLRAVLLETNFRPSGRLESMVSSGVMDASAAQALGEMIQATRTLAPDDWPYHPATPRFAAPSR